MILQFLHMLQHPSSVLSVFKQSSHIQHVIQVSLDLHLQLLTLGLFQSPQVFVQPEVSELILQVDAEVHVLH